MPRTIDSSGLTGFAFPNAQLSATVAGNALTIAIKDSTGADPGTTNPIFFAIASNVDGSVISYTIAAPLSITIPNGATLGFIASQSSRIWVAAFDDNGVIRLAVGNRLSTNFDIWPLSEDFGGTTSTLNTASDSSTILYSQVAISTSRKFRVIGYVTYETPLPTPGVWSVGPDTVQMLGPATKRPGELVSTGFIQTAAVQTGLIVAVPLDDTPPLQGEMSSGSSVVCGIFPRSNANILEHTIEINGSNPTANDQVVIASYNSSGTPLAAAIAAAFHTSPNLANAPIQLRLVFREQANRSISVYQAGVGTVSGLGFTVNGVAGARKLGGVMVSTYSIRELMG